MKSIQSRATSPMLRPIRLLRTSTSSVDQAETGTLRHAVQPTKHQTAEGTPMAIVISIELTESQSQ